MKDFENIKALKFMKQRPIYQKMGIKGGERAYFYNAPQTAVEAIGAPDLVIDAALDGQFDYINLFVVKKAELRELVPRIKPHLALSGKLWVSWPKAGKLKTDLKLDDVIRITYQYGLVESTNMRIDDTWTTLKFTWPKKGKVYNNSHGVLVRSPGDLER